MVCFLCKKVKHTLFGHGEDPDRNICGQCQAKKDTHTILYPNCTQTWHDSYDRHDPNSNGTKNRKR